MLSAFACLRPWDPSLQDGAVLVGSGTRGEQRVVSAACPSAPLSAHSWGFCGMWQGPSPQRAHGAGKGQVALLAGASRAPRTGSSCSLEMASQRQTSTDHGGPRGQRAQGDGAGMGHGHGSPAAGSALWGPGRPCAARRGVLHQGTGAVPVSPAGCGGGTVPVPTRVPSLG